MEKKGPPHIIHFFLDFLFFCQKSWGGFACNGLWLRLSLHSTSVCLEQRSPSLSSPSSLKKSFSPPKLKKKKGQTWVFELQNDRKSVWSEAP